MAVTLFGLQNELILTRSGTISIDNEGMATLSREYACATSYEATADTLLAIDSAVIGYTLPAGVSNLICESRTKSRANGVTTYAVNYIGITDQIYRIEYGTSILSYSKNITTGTPPDEVTDQYTGTYAAPTVTRAYVSSSASFVPSAPSSGYEIRILESYKNGEPASPPTLTKTWLVTGLTSTQVGAYYIIRATGTRTVTG
jgi:hypothetical protein